MNLTDKEMIELAELASASVDGRLTEPQRQRLEQWLRDSEMARRFYVRFMGLSADLSMIASESQSERTVRSGLAETSGLMGALTAWWRKERWRAALAVTASFLLVTALWLFTPREHVVERDEDVADATEFTGSTNSVAMLTRCAGVVWADETNTLDIGASLEPGWLRLKSGVVQVEFFSGARVILEGPAEFELVSSQESRLRFGKLSAHVPVPARGFKVHTAHMLVTDLGTEFGLNEELEKPSEVHVFNGKVQLEFNDTNQPMRELIAGEGARVDPDDQIKAMPADRGEFVSAEELQQREAVELRARYDEWKKTSEQFAADPALQIYFNFEEHQNKTEELTNRARSTEAGRTGTIVGCEWGEGRWPGKGALRFVNRGDRVRLKVPGTFESLTYAAWVSIDNLSRPNNALAMSQRFATGDVRWDISSAGAQRLVVRLIGTNSMTVSAPRTLKSHFGRWIHLAAVYDGPGTNVSLYLNGKCVAIKRFTEPVPLVLDDVELGNWSPLLNPPPTLTERRERQRPSSLVRNFHGRMDEFALLSRPLSAGEIRKLYEAGRQRNETILAAQSPSAK